jgi:hypothetical protein
MSLPLLDPANCALVLVDPQAGLAFEDFQNQALNEDVRTIGRRPRLPKGRWVPPLFMCSCTAASTVSTNDALAS